MSKLALALDEMYEKQLQQALSYDESEREAMGCVFRERYGADDRLKKFEQLRQTEYSYLDEQKQIYLDYTGGGLYASSQLDVHMAQLKANTFGNPHSSNPTSMASTQLFDATRDAVYRYFRADPSEYALVFTSNASGALKLIGESYPFEVNGQYLLTFDNHNSVNGIREYALHHGAKIDYAPITVPDLRLDADGLHEKLRAIIPGGNNLFAYPAQSNFSGVQHDLSWIEVAQGYGWDVVLDSAAFVPTNQLDLSRWKPDFVPLSFYKMFGYPTGIGALLARRDKLGKLRRPWFAGGTVEMVSAVMPIFSRAHGETAFEDGTVNYLGIPSIAIGLRHLESIGIEAIHEHVHAMTGYLLDVMKQVKHHDGTPVVIIYGCDDMAHRGGTVAFNLLDVDGEVFDVRLVEAFANQARISLRTGCFCNPGAGENAFHITVDDVVACSADVSSLTYARYISALSAHKGQNVTGAIRVSLGLASNFADIFHFVRFLHTFIDLKSPGFLNHITEK